MRALLLDDPAPAAERPLRLVDLADPTPGAGDGLPPPPVKREPALLRRSPTFALVMVSFVGLNIGAFRWMLDRHHEAVGRDTARWDRIEREMFELRAMLPLEYVRREDWIRFCGTSW